MTKGTVTNVSKVETGHTNRQVLVPVGPLISQIPATGDGFPTQDLADHWRPRGCGIACLRMILTTYGIDHGSYWSLVSQGLDAEAYCDRGWIHQGLIDIAARHGVTGSAHRGRTVIDLQHELCAGRLVIASVTVCFRGGQPRPGPPGAVYQPGGHLVLVTGVEVGERDDPIRFRVHHPSATEANNLSDHWVDREPFEASFNGNYLAFAASPSIRP